MSMSSTHEIHGIKVVITCSQGQISDVTRGRCIGKVVNACRNMDRSDFLAAMADSKTNGWGGPLYAALLKQMDALLESGYTKRSLDDFAPIATITIA